MVTTTGISVLRLLRAASPGFFNSRTSDRGAGRLDMGQPAAAGAEATASAAGPPPRRAKAAHRRHWARDHPLAVRRCNARRNWNAGSSTRCWRATARRGHHAWRGSGHRTEIALAADRRRVIRDIILLVDLLALILTVIFFRSLPLFVVLLLAAWVTVFTHRYIGQYGPVISGLRPGRFDPRKVHSPPPDSFAGRQLQRIAELVPPGTSRSTAGSLRSADTARRGRTGLSLSLHPRGRLPA